MGVKDHLEDGTGHILSLGLDLDYLHVNGAEQQAGLSTRMGAGNIETVQSITAAANHSCISTGGSCTSLHTHSSSSSSSWSNFSEGSVDSDDEHPHNVSDSVSQNLDKYSEEPPQEETLGLNDPVRECRNKVEFALKLGYPEELVVLVLRKLGPDALINDMLGELVKLGTKTDTEQQRGMTGSEFTFSPMASSSTNSSLASSQSSQLLQDKENLRPVVVDGSNVAMSHGNKEVFSCQGILLAVDWFLERGHRDITVFVPTWRKEQSRPDALITDQEILRRLEKDKILVFTPSRRVQGRRVVCYDDRFIVKLAYESDGIIVSNDNYRDLANEKPEWKKFIDERLLMYSFVNDKFMPPDDPLGRHGPSLENFLRKRPVIPEHRKQPCPYGKKCTYGHKCKFYHPERGSQPQRAVADELRASAKSSSVASKGVLKDALIVNRLGSGKPEAIFQPEQSWDTPKMQPAPSPQNSINDLLEDSFQVHSKLLGCWGSSSSSSCSSSILSHSTPAGPPLSVRLDPWEQHGACDRGSSRVTGATGSSLAESLHRCESPDLGYSSLVKAYTSLSLVVPQSPECFFPADLRGGSLLSDCSSEGSVSSDSFSPDPLKDVGPKCHHQYHHPHHHRHHHRLCSGQYTQPSSHVPPGLGQHVPFSYPIPQELWEQHNFGLDDHPSSSTSYASPYALKPPPAYFPNHSQHLFLNNVPGEFQTCPPHPSQTSTAHIHSQSSPLYRNVMGSLWKDGRFQDSQLYKGSTLHSRRNHCELNQMWDTHYRQSPKSCYDLLSHQSLPKAHEKAWPSPLDKQIHSSPHALSASSLPPLAPLSFPSISTPKSHLQSVPQHQEPPVLGQYQDHRERMFLNLCRIFSPDLVRMVMIRNPRVLDAQELAAAILMEKSQHAS